jgi:sec-independent protein translocase protein TatA
MSFASIGIPGLLLILGITLLLFGPKKLPELGRAIGQTFKGFKEETKGIIEEDDKPQDKKDSESK